MKLAAFKISSAFLTQFLSADPPGVWRPPYRCEDGIQRTTAEFLRAINEHEGVTLIFGDDSDPRFFDVQEGNQVPALNVVMTSMGPNNDFVRALNELHQRRYDSWSADTENLWKVVLEAFGIQVGPEVEEEGDGNHQG